MGILKKNYKRWARFIEENFPVFRVLGKMPIVMVL